MAGRFGTDVSLLAFLEAGGHSADVITDEDLDRDGVSALAPYRVAITGSFPAYASRAMLDAWEGYSSGGGRILYLGGGGFYWLTSYGSDRTVVEVRRGESGTRTWQAEPGEYDHATSGERCGLWRSKGRAPQKVFGVGLAATGRSAGIPYRRMPDSYHLSVAWVFDGVGDDLLGLKALCPGGVAGMEVDRYDRLLGSPPHARILASAIGLPNDYMKVSEEILFNHPGLSGGEDHQVRADMVLFTTRNGGAVFSAGSSAWISGLPVNDFDNPVAQITRNILDAFVARGRLRGSRFDDEDDLTGGGPQDHVDSGPH
jgi:N,N-dimethylformamidase